MKRCINCGNLLAEKDRDVCLRCLSMALKHDKKVIVKNMEVLQ